MNAKQQHPTAYSKTALRLLHDAISEHLQDRHDYGPMMIDMAGSQTVDQLKDAYDMHAPAIMDHDDQEEAHEANWNAILVAYRAKVLITLAMSGQSSQVLHTAYHHAAGLPNEEGEAIGYWLQEIWRKS